MDNLGLLLRVFITGLLTLLPVAWVHQQSLESFWQQRYHVPAPWLEWGNLPVWQAGSRLQPAVKLAAHSFWSELSGRPATPSDTASDLAIVQQQADCPSPEIATATPLPAVVEQAPPQPVIQFKSKARLLPGKRVFFAGDSMMQGVAPHLARRLRQEHGITSLDLSRQSTGLAYPGSFNWPRTISDTLSHNPDIGVLAIFMGPNDPWDMPPKGGGKFLKFRTPEWEALYRERIRQILDDAKARGVDVIWLAPPLMRKTQLSDKVDYIASLYESEVLEAGEVFLSTNQVLGYLDGQYSDYPGSGTPRQKLRSGDGIHFTLAGQRLLADALYQQLHIEPAAEPALAATESGPQP